MHTQVGTGKYRNLHVNGIKFCCRFPLLTYFFYSSCFIFTVSLSFRKTTFVFPSTTSNTKWRPPAHIYFFFPFKNKEEKWREKEVAVHNISACRNVIERKKEKKNEILRSLNFVLLLFFSPARRRYILR